VELRFYLGLLRRWAWLVILCMVVAGGSAYLWSSRAPNIYRATTILLISEGSATGRDAYTDLIASERLARTYVQRITNQLVLNETAQLLGLSRGMLHVPSIRIALIPDTQLIRLSVDDETPELAQALANTIPEVFIRLNERQQAARFASSKVNLEAQLEITRQDIASTQEELNAARDTSAPTEERIARLEERLSQLRVTQASLLQSYEQVRLTEATSQNSVIVDVPAPLPTVPIAPQPLRMALLAGLAGAILGFAIAFLHEYLDDTVPVDSEMGHLLGTSVLAMIGRIGRSDKRVLVVGKESYSADAEAYRMLNMNLRFLAIDEPVKCIVVTSPAPGDGKSLTASNLAITLASAGHRTILIDADLHRPTQHKIFETSSKEGLTTALVDQTLPVTHYLQPTHTDELRLLPSGPMPPNPSRLLASQRMRELLTALQQEADYVIVDSAPILAVSDTSILSTLATGVILVLRAKKTKLEAARRAAEQLQSVQANLLGIVINDVPSGSADNYYYYYSSKATSRSVGPGAVDVAGSRSLLNSRRPAEQGTGWLRKLRRSVFR
jgi:succinoglycan biosynthesis transport protein ExoP